MSDTSALLRGGARYSMLTFATDTVHTRHDTTAIIAIHNGPVCSRLLRRRTVSISSHITRNIARKYAVRWCVVTTLIMANRPTRIICTGLSWVPDHPRSELSTASTVNEIASDSYENAASKNT